MLWHGEGKQRFGFKPFMFPDEFDSRSSRLATLEQR
jgi:hypothetical protein